MADKLDHNGRKRRYVAFGAELQLRRRLKYSQEQFARIVGADPDTVGAWERGLSFPSRDYWPTIERELDFTKVEIRELLASNRASGSTGTAARGSAAARSGRTLSGVDGAPFEHTSQYDKAAELPPSIDVMPISGIDLWTPGPASGHIFQVYAPEVGDKTASRITRLAEEAVTAIGRGDFAAQGRIAGEVLAIGQDANSARLRGEAGYLRAESLRLMADFEMDRSRVRSLRGQALDAYDNSAIDLGDDPRPLRGSARVLEVLGDPDAALVQFGKATSLSEEKLAHSHPLSRFSLAHEHIRSMRHTFNCLAEIETNSLLPSSGRIDQLERLLEQSEQKHEQVLARFRHAEIWWRIEWFMAQVFHARGWAAVNQHGLAAKRLKWGLEQRLRMMPEAGPVSDVETGNLNWWLRTALSVAAGFEPEERRKLERLAAEIGSNTSRDRIHAAGQALLQLQRAPWERGSTANRRSTGE